MKRKEGRWSGFKEGGDGRRMKGWGRRRRLRRKTMREGNEMKTKKERIEGGGGGKEDRQRRRQIQTKSISVAQGSRNILCS